MTRKRRKAVSFDAMVKYFMLNYDIPTKADLEKLHKRLDHLEMLVKRQPAGSGADKAAKPASSAGNTASTGSEPKRTATTITSVHTIPIEEEA